MIRPVAGSSNGRTPGSGPGSQGSNPCPAASETTGNGGFLRELEHEERDRRHRTEHHEEHGADEPVEDEPELPRRERPEQRGDAELAELPAPGDDPRRTEHREEPARRDEANLVGPLPRRDRPAAHPERVPAGRTAARMRGRPPKRTPPRPLQV